MGNRKRVNLSLDQETYGRLQEIRRKHGFSNACELVVAFVRILLDRMEEEKKYDLPEEDGKYIDRMFKELGDQQRGPDGGVPVRHNNKKLK